MAIANRYVVLYFVLGPVPSQEQLVEARSFGPHVMYRNALHVREDEGCEPCTAVAGDAPSQYKRRYPKAVTYAEWLEGKLPTTEAAPTPGQLAMGGGFSALPLSARFLDPDTPRRRAAPSVPVEADPAMTGVETPSLLPPPPRGSTTGAIELPPPPPPPPPPRPES